MDVIGIIVYSMTKLCKLCTLAKTYEDLMSQKLEGGGTSIYAVSPFTSDDSSDLEFFQPCVKNT